MSKIITPYSFPSQECIVDLISSQSQRVVIVACEHLLNMLGRNTGNLFKYGITCCFCFEGTANCFAIDASVLKYISLVSIP